MSNAVGNLMLQHFRSIPTRSAAWMGKQGPVAWWGVNSPNNYGPQLVRAALQHPSSSTATDFYTHVEFLSKGTTSVTPTRDQALNLPVLDVGDWELTVDNADSFDYVKAGAATLCEKGYVP